MKSKKINNNPLSDLQKFAGHKKSDKIAQGRRKSFKTKRMIDVPNGDRVKRTLYLDKMTNTVVILYKGEYVKVKKHSFNNVWYVTN